MIFNFNAVLGGIRIQKIGFSLEDLFESNRKIQKESVETIRKISSLNELKILKISELVYQKIFKTIQTAFNVRGRPVESYWLYLGDNENIIQDILVPHQYISSAHVEIPIEAILKLNKFLQGLQNMSLLGWGHSHADFNVFFSGTDWQNQTRLYYETSNYRIITNEKEKSQLIKYVYGSTFNIHKETFVQLTWQFKNGPITHETIPIEIVKQEEFLEKKIDTFSEEIKTLFH